MPGFIMTLAEAKQVQDAFGGCTTIGECWDKGDLISAATAHDSFAEFVLHLCVIEGIQRDRQLGAMCDSGEMNDEQELDALHRRDTGGL